MKAVKAELRTYKFTVLLDNGDSFDITMKAFNEDCFETDILDDVGKFVNLKDSDTSGVLIEKKRIKAVRYEVVSEEE